MAVLPDPRTHGLHGYCLLLFVHKKETVTETGLGDCASIFPRIRGHINLLLFSVGDANRGGGSDTIQFTHIPAGIFSAVIPHQGGSLAGRSGDSRVCWNASGS